MDELINGARKTLLTMQKNSIYAIGKVKKATLEGVDLDLEKGLEIERSVFSELFNSFDAKEGIRAFFEKRHAKFEHMKGE
jgi:enoyl-CoA hydratase/carnithine racemase